MVLLFLHEFQSIYLSTKGCSIRLKRSSLRFKEGSTSTILLVLWHNFSDWFNFFYAGIKRGNVASFPLSAFYWDQSSSSIKVTLSSSGIIAKKSTSKDSFLASYEAISAYFSTSIVQPSVNNRANLSYSTVPILYSPSTHFPFVTTSSRNPSVTSTLISQGKTTLVF